MKISDYIDQAMNISNEISKLKSTLDSTSLNLDFRVGLTGLEKELRQSGFWLNGYISALMDVSDGCSEGDDLEIQSSCVKRGAV